MLVWASCKKDDPKPLQAEVNAKLLAGDFGKSKSWSITGGTFQFSSGSVQPFNVSDCISDNIYTFTNDNSQTYQATEGSTKCAANDPDVVESGTWAFTRDGKMIIILSNNTTNSAGSIFSYKGFAFPAEVIQITDASLQIKMTVTSSTSATKTYIFNFTKI